MAPRLDGIALGCIAAGGVLAYAGVRGKSIPSLIQGFVQGKSPSAATSASQIAETSGNITGTTATTSSSAAGTIGTSGDTGGGNSAGTNQGLARLSVIVSHPSWASGQEWDDWVSLWNQESGWNNYATNSGSGAFGIAQALGHGNGAATQGTKVIEGSTHNEYGGYGLSDAAAVNANNGDALPQIQWGINYIASTYGSPSAAWAHEQANDWY